MQYTIALTFGCGTSLSFALLFCLFLIKGLRALEILLYVLCVLVYSKSVSITKKQMQFTMLPSMTVQEGF